MVVAVPASPQATLHIKPEGHAMPPSAGAGGTMTPPSPKLTAPLLLPGRTNPPSPPASPPPLPLLPPLLLPLLPLAAPPLSAGKAGRSLLLPHPDDARHISTQADSQAATKNIEKRRMVPPARK